MHGPAETFHPGIVEALPVLSRLLHALGFPKGCARILAALYLSDKPLSSKELIEITGYSKSSVSAAVKMLEGKRLVRKFKHGRFGVYAPSISLSQLFLEAQIGLLNRARSRVRELKDRGNSSFSARLERVEKDLTRLIARLKGEDA